MLQPRDPLFAGTDAQLGLPAAQHRTHLVSPGPAHLVRPQPPPADVQDLLYTLTAQVRQLEDRVARLERPWWVRLGAWCRSIWKRGIPRW